MQAANVENANRFELKSPDKLKLILSIFKKTIWIVDSESLASVLICFRKPLWLRHNDYEHLSLTTPLSKTHYIQWWSLSEKPPPGQQFLSFKVLLLLDEYSFGPKFRLHPSLLVNTNHYPISIRSGSRNLLMKAPYFPLSACALFLEAVTSP